MDKVVHFEIPVDDPARAEFYGSIFRLGPGRLGHGRRRDHTSVRTVTTDDNQLPTGPA